MPEKTTGHDPLTVRMVEVLERIEAQVTGLHDEVRTTNVRLTELRGEVAGVREDLNALREETRGEIMDIRSTAHDIRGELIDLRSEVRAMGDRERAREEHEARIVRLEQAVFKRTG
jgi:predicted  nucleic acid-binding Zn-ribbon protein